MHHNATPLSRRKFIASSALSMAALASGALVGCAGSERSKRGSSSGPASWNFSLDQNWLFGGKLAGRSLNDRLDDAAFSRVSVPHCVTTLSWQNWDPKDWEDQWFYRRHFSLPKECQNRRVFLHFDGVMVGAKPSLNGKTLPEHYGGYLPFHYEITDSVKDENVLTLIVDSRWSSVPPEGSPRGPSSVDYLEAGGIHRPVALRVVPQIFINDVFAKPVSVLDANRRVEVACSIDATVLPEKPLRIKVELKREGRVIARAEAPVTIEKPGETTVNLTLSNLGDIQLWHVDDPKLYDVVTTLLVGGAPLHDCRTRIGFRDARFEVDGFFLNGKQFRLFGLDRHEIFPYVGYAVPARTKRHDAEMLRHEFNCNAVRCSHYPQSEAFLDACDELGLLVWQETPGWQFIGDEAWQDLVLRDVQEMVRRDRNHPSIVIWGVRVNESKNMPALYEQTTAAAKALDDSRPTSGSMTSSSVNGWHEDIFALDDYHSAPDGSVGIKPPVPDVPYMLAETVGQFSYQAKKGFNNRYRRAGEIELQTQQAVFHAQAHDRAAVYPRMAGVIAWCAFDYASLVNPYHTVKCPGIADIFRIPKLGASFYQAQASPAVRPVILPSFFWDFGPATPKGPGKNAAIFSNCDRLEIFVGEKQVATVQPDRANYPHLQYPPFFCDLEIDNVGAKPELRIDGYVGSRLALSKSFSSDAARDELFLAADDRRLSGDGVDATRLVFKVVDKFGAERAFADGEVTFEISGPGIIVGDNPFALTDSGGVGAVWIKTIPDGSGQIIVTAIHSSRGKKSVSIDVQPDSASRKI
ncbi:MAG TPA: glycoside hydrolase family 2 TIM barrel-domain containing protein [Verrucomicrobiae bacterium]